MFLKRSDTVIQVLKGKLINLFCVTGCNNVSSERCYVCVWDCLVIAVYKSSVIVKSILFKYSFVNLAFVTIIIL